MQILNYKGIKMHTAPINLSGSYWSKRDEKVPQKRINNQSMFVQNDGNKLNNFEKRENNKSPDPSHNTAKQLEGLQKETQLCINN